MRNFQSCTVCRSNASFREHEVPSCRYGPGPAVLYLECSECGSLRIARRPTSVDDEYGPGYHYVARSGVKARLEDFRDVYAATGRGIVGRGLAWLIPPLLEDFPETLRLAGAGPERRGSARILDVGTGNGGLLFQLHAAGYRRLVGVDPFLPPREVLPTAPGIRLERTAVEAMAAGDESGSLESFDLIMFHHSLEHIPDPEGALTAARRLLSPGGRIMVRVPVVPCLAWERYGVQWVQLDAPRHLTIFSRSGLPALAGRAGLELEHARDDSTELQFLGSELYRKGRPLSELRSRFGWRERRRRRREARALNREGRGDQAAFIFRPTAPTPPAR